MIAICLGFVSLAMHKLGLVGSVELQLGLLRGSARMCNINSVRAHLRGLHVPTRD